MRATNYSPQMVSLHKPELKVTPLGERALKNVAAPVGLYTVER